MVRQCQVCGKLDSFHPDLSFHRFPVNPERRNIWFSLLGFDKKQDLPKHPEICSNHFKPSDIITKQNGLRYIKQEANPIPIDLFFLSPTPDSDSSFEKNETQVENENNEVLNETENTQGIVLNDWDIKDEKADIKEEDLEENEIRSRDVFCGQNEASVKIENTESFGEMGMVHDILFDEWKIKNDEVEIKEENPEPNETSISTDCLDQDILDYQCAHCSYKTSCQDSIRTHLERHTLGCVFKCHRCMYKTSRKKLLKRHLVQHNFSKGFNVFKCDQCIFETFSKFRLDRHILWHKSPDQVNTQTTPKGSLKKSTC